MILAGRPFMLPNGGTSNDTTKVQAVFDACTDAGGGIISAVPGSTYTIDPITVGGNTTVYAPGATFVQRAAASTSLSGLFDINNVSNIRFASCNLLGTATPGGGIANGASGNTAFMVRGGASNVWVESCDIRQFLHYPIWIVESTDVVFRGNYLFENCFGPRGSHAQRVLFEGNTLNRTCLYSLTPTPSQFAVGFGLDSTDPISAVSYDPCTDIRIIGNHVEGFPYAQGVLIHAGQRVVVDGNIINGSSVGISANPFNTTDTIRDITISNNIIEGTAATLPDGSADAGIVASAGPASGGGNTPNIINATISGNTVHAANRAIQATSSGGYQIGYTEALCLTGNTADGCGANGFVFAETESGAIVTGNTVRNPVVVGTTQVGFNWLGAPRATMMGNMVANASDTNGIGYKVATATDMKWKDSGGNLLNGTYNCTTASA